MSDSDSDESQRSWTSRLKCRKKSLSEEKNTRVQEIFEKLKAQPGYKYTGPWYCLLMLIITQVIIWASSKLLFSAIQGYAHGIRKSGSTEVVSTAVTTLATSLVALKPCCESSCATAGLSTPPQHTSRSPVMTLVKAGQLKTTYINQIKELYSLVEIGALTTEQYKMLLDSVLQKMDKLNPRI